MKLIQRLTLLSSLALLATACDLQQTFDERIDDKQLLVLTPDFADTSVQLVFRDPETLAVLDEDFEVTVYSNKRLVDLNGNYKNQFIARGGVMEFSVSPEETVTESDPLELGIIGSGLNNSKMIKFAERTFSSKGPHTSLLMVQERPSFQENIEEINRIGINKFNDDSNIPSNSTTQDISLTVQFNNQTVPIYPNCFRINGVCLSDLRVLVDVLGGFWGGNLIYYGTIEGFLAVISRNSSGLTVKTKLTDDLKISIRGAGRELVGYDLVTLFFDQAVNLFETNKSYTNIKVDQDGKYTAREYLYSPDDQKFSVLPWRSGEGVIPNYLHEITVKKGMNFGATELQYWTRSDYKVCDQGFNLTIEGAAPGENLNLIYKATRRSDNKIFTIASFNADNSNSRYNSLQDGGNSKHVIAVKGNTLEFLENSQYIIEPQVIDLGGEELCGNTYTVRLKRRDTHKKHQLNLSMRNENQNVGLALTFSALLRKQGQDNASWETVNFKQGSTSLFLEEGSTYEVKLTLADEPFEFTFTNDLSLVEAAVQATLRNVTRIKDIKYSISESAEANTIDAEIVFYQGQSLID